jgi:hypothetical protein
MVQIILALTLVSRVLASKISRDPLYSWYKGLNPDNVLVAINCGSNESLTDMNGVVWAYDQYFQGGVDSSEGGNQRWVLPDTELYHTERWGNSFSYLIPFDVMVDGDYTLVLKFSEQYFERPGEKVFDVKVGSTTVIANLDPLSKAGNKLFPWDGFVEFKTKRGEVYINGGKVNDAIKNGSLLLLFAKG